jgi:hypothetical protein
VDECKPLEDGEDGEDGDGELATFRARQLARKVAVPDGPKPTHVGGDGGGSGHGATHALTSPHAAAAAANSDADTGVPASAEEAGVPAGTDVPANILGRAVQVDPIKPRVESAPGFSA